MKLPIKIRRVSAALLSAAFVGLFAQAGYYSRRLPETVTADSSGVVRIAEYPEISCGGSPFSDESPDKVTLSLYGAIPVKSVEVRENSAPTLIAGGSPFGIKLLMEGVMVTEIGGIDDGSGALCYPAKNCGIEVGDVICCANGVPVTSNKHLQEVISGSGGLPVRLTVRHGEERFETELDPVRSPSDGKWRGGMWVRDSIAGIGTMTFINKETGEFAGLGHPICDSDTGELVPLHSGEAVHVEINETKAGRKGVPGELRGRFINGETYGALCINNECGIFGKLTEDELRSAVSCGEEYQMGMRQEITTGSAEIVATVSGTVPEHYTAEIERIDLGSGSSTKNMVIRITDPRLLEHTGGIVQGMSGSPIIQNGKLIGAVTHVFVADPTRGYAIFAENMANSMHNS